jgi:hypothetical protein
MVGFHYIDVDVGVEGDADIDDTESSESIAAAS